MATLLSVGIDVGTTTTQVVFSHIALDNVAGYFSAPKISITDREIIYRGPVHRTPLSDSVHIDGAALADIVRGEFDRAGYTPEQVDTGAVIITGESARKENAAIVLENLSRFAGSFVVSTAGPDLESAVAGKGSGAWTYSRENECRVLNLDIGGGTTNLALFDCGELVHRSCYDIGGHLVLVDGDLKVLSVSPPARIVAEAEGLPIAPGSRTTIGDLERLTRRMAELLACAAGLGGDSELLERLRTPNSANETAPRADRLCFSGGVAACMANPPADPMAYGDIGPLLAKAILNGRLCRDTRQIPAGETIGATVIGAGVYTTSLSGSTIFYQQGILPVKNVPALRLDSEAERNLYAGSGEALERQVRWFMDQGDAENLLICMKGQGDPSFEALKACAETLCDVLDAALPFGAPILVAMENDTAKAAGTLMARHANGARRVAVIDAIRPVTGEYVDIGPPVMNGMVVPVAVKTLLFG